MTENTAIDRRRFIRSMAGFCTLLLYRPDSILDRAGHAGIESLVLLAALQRQVRRDFELGRTIEFDGWILSETEARLCALVARPDS